MTRLGWAIDKPSVNEGKLQLRMSTPATVLSAPHAATSRAVAIRVSRGIRRVI
ncbi:MAG: hypothetical protein ACYTHJ_15470 [Planctomycetota bacterium]